jgi:ankyrin repeat protein
MDIYDAALRGATKKLIELLDSGVDSNSSNEQKYTPIMAASHDGRLENIQILADRGADINAVADDGFTALTNAVQHSTIETVKLLVSLGANVNHITDSGFTLLMIAPYNNYPPTDKAELVAYLLSVGVDKNIKDSGGLLAADHAERKSCDDLNELLKPE